MPSDELVREVEDDIDDLEREGREMLREFSRLIPRFAGSVKVSPADRKFDYDTRQPGYWEAQQANAIKEAATSGGTQGDVWLALLKHDAEFRE